MLETVLTGRNLLSPTLTSAARDVESYDAKVTAASTRASAAADASSKAQATAADRVVAANSRSASSSEAMSAKIAASQAKASESTRAFADVTESSAARVAASYGSLATKALPLVAAAGTVVFGKMAADYQTLVTRLETTAGESAKNIGMVSKGMLDMAGQVGVSADDLAKAMYTVDSANIHGADSLSVLKAAAQGAKQEGADLGTVVNAVTTILHDYHEPASDAAKVTSELVTAVSHGKTNFQDLAGSLDAITPLASKANISLADITGTLAAMTASGMSADQASQNIENTLMHLANPTSTMIAELAQLGVSTDDLANSLSTKGLAGTLQMVETAIVQHLDPATQRVLLPALNKSKTAVADLHTMVGQMPPALAKLSQSFLDGKTSLSDYRKDARDLGGQQAAMGLQFLSLVQSSQGFNNALKAGGPNAQVFTAAMAKAFGTTSALNVALQTTGENAGQTNATIADIAKSAGDAQGNVKGWSEVQGNLNQKMAEAGAEAKTMAIEIGQHVLPAATATFGWIASTGLPTLEHLGSAAGTAAHEFMGLPAPIREAAVAFAAIKLAETIGLWSRLTAIPGQFGGAVRSVASSMGGFSDEVRLQQTLMTMQARQADVSARSVEGLGRAEQSAAVWARSAATADEEAAAVAQASSARRVAAIQQLTAGASMQASNLSRAQMAMRGWDTELAGAAPVAETANVSTGRFSATLATLSARGVPAVKAGLSGLMGLLGGPWGVAIIGATVGISALASAFERHDAEVRKDTDDVKKWSEAIALGGGGTSAIAAEKHLDDLKQKIAAVTEKINEYNAAAAGGYARGGIGNLITQQKELQSELDKGTKAWKDQLAGMTPVQVAQERLTLAQQDLNDALKHNPATSQAVIVAESNLAEAQHRLGLETDNANRAAKTQIQQQQDQADKALGLVDAQRQAQEASLALTQQVTDYNAQVADGSLKGTALKQATLGIVDAAEQAAKAAGDAAAKQAAQNGATDTGAASQAAFMKTLQDFDSTLTGPAKKAMDDYIAQLGGQQSQAQLTAGTISQLGVTVTDLPDSHLITINAPTADQETKLHQLGYDTVHLPNGQVIVTADTNPALGAIQDLLAYARKQSIQYRSDLPDLVPGVSGGGRMGHAATGGEIHGPGTGTSDTAGLWALSNGEFVVNAKATAQHRELLHAINDGRVGAMAAGGYVGPSTVTIPVSVDETQAEGVIAQMYKAAAAAAFAGGGGGAGDPYIRNLGMQIANSMGVGGQFSAIDYIFSHESGWNPMAKNPSSTAFGIPQFLASTWAAYGGVSVDPAVQIRDGILYMENRYGSPNAAASFWAAHHWYKNGTPYVPETGPAVLHQGEAVLTTEQAEAYRAGLRAAPAMPGYGTPFSGAHFGPTGPVNVAAQVRVFVGDREITDIVRVEATAVVDREMGALADTIHYAGGSS